MTDNSNNSDDSDNAIEPQEPGIMSLSKTGGRRAALNVIDSMMGDSNNLQLLREKMQAAFEIDPYRFFKEIVMPLTPKTINVDGASEGQNIQINIMQITKEDADKLQVKSNIVANLGDPPEGMES